MDKRAASGELPSLQMLAVLVVIWIVDKSDRCVIADVVEHMSFPSTLDKATASMLCVLPGAFVDVLGEVFGR